MCLTSAFALFKLKLFDIHDLSGNRNTDAYSLCVNAALFNRMQFALVRYSGFPGGRESVTVR